MLTTDNMAAKCVVRNSDGTIHSEADIALPAGLTHDEAVAYVRKWNKNEISGFYTYS
jgi:hypothetical protein